MASSVARRTSEPVSLYDTDFHLWAETQAGMLRRLRHADIDWDNVAEEIESLGRRDRAALENHLEIVIAHLLKCVVQPQRRSASWDRTVREQRREIVKAISRSPSLKTTPESSFDEAYRQAAWRVFRDTGIELDKLPGVSPFTLDQVLDPDFWP